MRKPFYFIYGLFLLAQLLPAVIHAEDELAPGFNACIDKAVSTADNVDCLTKAYNHWDAILNNNYKECMNLCKEAGNPKACHDNLVKAQRLWIQYKESMIKVIYDLGGGGTMDKLTANSFLANETKKQAQLLTPER